MKNNQTTEGQYNILAIECQTIGLEFVLYNSGMPKITVETIVNKPVAKVWESWTLPEHITKWNQASPDWHCPSASNDLRVGGSFSSTMAAKDGSSSFDFAGVYTKVTPHKEISYKMADNREVEIIFNEEGDNSTKIIETFDAETSHSLEQQEEGWQSIMNNFKNYTENLT